MIKTVYNAQDIYLLDVAPDWDAPFLLQASLPSNIDKGLTIRESRRNLAGTLRLTADYGITADGSDARRVEAGLKALQNERVVVPLWPAVVKWSDRAAAPIVGGLKIAFKEDFSQWAIYEGVEPGWPAPGDLVAPLLWGRLDARQADWRNPGVLEFKVQFTEASPANYAISPVAPAWTAGPRPPAWVAAGVAAPDIFPFEINLVEAEAENFSIEVLREQIGFGREPAETFYPQAAARELTGEHVAFDGNDSAKLLKFFLEHATKAFWVPNWAIAALLTANIGAADTVLHIDTIYNVSPGDYVAFIQAGQIVCGRRVTAVGAGTITVDSAPGTLSAATTLVCGLVLSRFNSSMLELQWLNGAVAECKTQFREVSQEYTPDADETLGTTIGGLPTRCWLYEFARVLNGVTFTDRFTSFEANLTFGGNTYFSKKGGITHKQITAGLELDADQVELQTDAFAGNPLIDVAAIRAQSPLLIKIIQGEVNAGTAVNTQQLFIGEVVKAPLIGSRIGAIVVTGSSMFDRNIPRPRFQTWCNNSLFDKGCGLAKADWKFTATVSNPGAPGYPFTFDLQSLARSAPVKATVERGRAANVATLKVTAHGYINGTVLKITLLGGAGYNQSGAVITVIDADHFSYPNAGANEGTTGDVNGRVTWDAPTFTADWFAGGWIEFKPAPGDELTWSRLAIVGSTIPIAGALTVTLHGDPLVFPAVGDAVVLFPGCDLTAEICIAKYNNYLNFLGHRFMPIANPSLTTGGQPAGGGKK